MAQPASHTKTGVRAKGLLTLLAQEMLLSPALSGVIELSTHGQTISELHSDELYRLLHFANACGDIATTARGAIPSLSTKRRVDQLCAGNKYDSHLMV